MTQMLAGLPERKGFQSRDRSAGSISQSTRVHDETVGHLQKQADVNKNKSGLK